MFPKNRDSYQGVDWFYSPRIFLYMIIHSISYRAYCDVLLVAPTTTAIASNHMPEEEWLDRGYQVTEATYEEKRKAGGKVLI